MSQNPYIIKEIIKIVREYNPEYGDHRICECGHNYDRHFDSYDDMAAVGCKYCDCFEFIENPEGAKTRKEAESAGYEDGKSGAVKNTEYLSTKWQADYDRWYEYGFHQREE